MNESREQDNFPTIAILSYTILVLLVNTGMGFNAYSKGGWAQIGLLIFLAPIVDGILLILGILFMRHLQKQYPEKELGIHWLAAIGAPVVSYITLALLTLQFSKGGC